MIRAGRTVPAAVAALLAPVQAAWAHGSVQGMHAFYAGLFHPFQNLPHLLLLAALGIWLGRKPALSLAPPVLAFGVAAALGLLATTTAWAGPGRVLSAHPVLLTGLVVLIGLAVACNVAVPSWWRAAIAALAAIAVALDSGLEGEPVIGVLAVVLAGNWIAMVVLVVNLAYYVSVVPSRQWMQIGLRVSGSWLCAAGMLVLAFQLKAA